MNGRVHLEAWSYETNAWLKISSPPCLLQYGEGKWNYWESREKGFSPPGLSLPSGEVGSEFNNGNSKNSK